MEQWQRESIRKARGRKTTWKNLLATLILFILAIGVLMLIVYVQEGGI